MTVSTTNAFDGPYLANGATVAFPFTFAVMAASEVSVLLRDAEGVETIADSGDYSVTLDGAAPSDGTVTFDSAPASGLSVVLYASPPFTQNTAFEDGSAWKAAPVNNVNDRSALRDQALKRDIGRALLMPMDEAGVTLPASAESSFLGWDGDGNFGVIPEADYTGPLESIRDQALVYRDEAEGFSEATEVLRDETQVLRDEAAAYAAAVAGFLPQYTYGTYAAASAALAGIPANQYLYVIADETHAGRGAYYQKSGGVLVFVAYGSGSSGGVTWWIDPSAASDGIGTGTSPFKYFSTLLTYLSDGDTVKGCYNATGWQTVKETVDASAFDNITWDLPGFIFQAFDTTSLTWTATGTANVWQATTTLNFTGSGATGAAHLPSSNKVYAGFIGGGTVCPTWSISGTAVDGQLGTQSAATINAALTSQAELTFAIRNGPVVGGTPSGQTNGWVTGSHDIHLKSTTDPNTLTWKVQQRGQPTFGYGHRFKGHMVVVGGWGSNGFFAYDPTLEGILDIWYCANHGCIVPGIQGPGKIRVFYKQQTWSSGYAIHLFNGGTRRRFAYLNGPEITGFNNSSLDSCFGGHGSGQPNDIGEGVEINDAVLTNVWSIGCPGEMTNPAVFNRLKARGVQITNWISNSMTAHDPDIVQSNGSTSGLFGPIASGKTLNIVGGAITGNPQGLFTQGSATGGTINFTRTKIRVGAETVNARWWSATTGTWNFTECLIEAVGGSFAQGLMGASNGSTVNVTDSAVAGMAWPTATTFTRCQRGGRIGLRLGPDDSLAALTEYGLERALGEPIIGVAWALNNADAYTVSSMSGHALTRRGVYTFGGTNSTISALPKWTALNSYSLTGLAAAYKQFSGNWIVAYGTSGGNPVVLVYSTSAGVSSSPTAVDMSAFAGKVPSGHVEGGTDGKLWIGFTTGEIAEIDASTAVATARTSGVTYPLLGGVRNGTTVLMVGSDASGSSGTVGGAIVSTDTGGTWGNSIASGDASSADTGDWEKRLKCATYVNGYYIISGTRGTWLYSTTAASGSWSVSSLGVDIDVRTMAADTVNKRILLGGDPGLGPNYRGAPMIYVDADATVGTVLKGSKTYDPANLADGAGVTTTVTVTGVALGDYVDDVSLSIDNANVTVTGEVTSANTVTVTYQNESGGAVDLASHTVTVLCRTATAHPGTWKYQSVECPVSAVGPRIIFAGNVTVSSGVITPDCWVVPGQLAQVAIGEDPRGGWRRTEWPLQQRTYTRDYTSPFNAVMLGA